MERCLQRPALTGFLRECRLHKDCSDPLKHVLADLIDRQLLNTRLTE